MKRFFLLVLLSLCCFVIGHEGHEYISPEILEQGRPATWSQWVGSFHLFFLHFPVALIYMLVICECLLAWQHRPVFDFSARFLMYSAAIVSLPTVLLGLVYSYSASYEGLMEIFLWWHMWLGILTAVFAFLVVLMREKLDVGKMYYGCLLILFLLVNIAGYFGAGMTFGPALILFPQ